MNRDPQGRLEAALARAGEVIDRMRAGEPDEPAGLSLLAELATAPEAPAHWRALAARVAAGEATWVDVWAQPAAHPPAGGELLVAVLRRLAADLGHRA